MASLEKGFKRMMGAAGLTLAGLLTFAFFLGNLHARVSESADKTDKLYSVVALDKDSLQSRVGVIENRITSMETRLNKIESRLDGFDSRLASMGADLKELKELIRSRARTPVTPKRSASPQ